MINKQKRATFIVGALAILILGGGCNGTKERHVEGIQSSSSNVEQPTTKKLALQIILGSTRQGRMSDKIGNALKAMADKRTDVAPEIVDIKDYNLPFLYEEIYPSEREEFTDLIIKKWSDKISQADAFIIVVPVYNSGYPGVLKNALDLLYKEWHNKPVAFVGYSGGSSGGASVIAQLRQVAQELKMIPVDADIKIPHSWKALDEKGALVDKNIEPQLSGIIDQLISAQTSK